MTLVTRRPKDNDVPQKEQLMNNSATRYSTRNVVFVDGVRTPFGKAKPDGYYARTRADDLVVKALRELLRRNPALPADHIDDVAIAATTQQGDQGLTLGRTVALLAFPNQSRVLQ